MLLRRCIASVGFGLDFPSPIYALDQCLHERINPINRRYQSGGPPVPGDPRTGSSGPPSHIAHLFRDNQRLNRRLGAVGPDQTAWKGSGSDEPSAVRSGNRIPPSALFACGDVVRFRADPARTGAVTAVHSGETEPRYKIFHDGKVASYYQSQLLPSVSHSPWNHLPSPEGITYRLPARFAGRITVSTWNCRRSVRSANRPPSIERTAFSFKHLLFSAGISVRFMTKLLHATRLT